jgi:hypothetical protein
MCAGRQAGGEQQQMLEPIEKKAKQQTSSKLVL